MSKDNFTLFVGDLSLFCNAQHLKQAFSKFGEIRAVRIAFDEVSQKQLHFGFVEFTSYDAALSALTAMNGTVLCGRILRVKWAINRHDAATEEVRKPTNFRLETSSVHVNFLSYQTTKLVSEELLRSIFSAFGEVKDVIIKKSTKENNVQRGYGFVHYSNSAEGIQSTLAAISNMFDVTIDNVNYTCAMSHACEQGFVNPSSSNPLFNGSLASQSQSSHSNYSSRQPSPPQSYLLPPSHPNMSTEGYYVQTPPPPGSFVPAYGESLRALPPSEQQYYIYAPSTSSTYHPYTQAPYGYADGVVQQQPVYYSVAPAPVGQTMMSYSSAPPGQYAGISYDYRVASPMQSLYYGQQQQQHLPQGQYRSVPMQQQPMHRGMQQQPRPFQLLSSVGRSNSEPISPPRLSYPQHFVARQYHSAYELSSTQGGSAPVTPSNRTINYA